MSRFARWARTQPLREVRPLADDFGDGVGPHEGRRDPAWAAAG